MAKPKTPKSVTSHAHDEATRPNIPTAELQSLAEMAEEQAPRPPVAYPRAWPLAEGKTRERDADLDPQVVWNGAKITLTAEQVAQLAETGTVEIGDAQLVWRGKDTQDWSDLVVHVPPLYVQETIHPKALIDALKRETERAGAETTDAPDLFETLRVPDAEDRTEFYAHEQDWTNRMILGDSLQVMASLAERERLRGKVQAIYFDPPYGIKFNSNWQVSTRSRDVKDGKTDSLTREPEQVKAFRDTWKDGIHSYLTYLRDRLTVMRDLLTESGSIFVQIGDENVHRVRAVMDEVFGDDNHCASIEFKKTAYATSDLLPPVNDTILWYAKRKDVVKYSQLYTRKERGDPGTVNYDYVRNSVTMNEMKLRPTDPLPPKPAVGEWEVFRLDNLMSVGFRTNTSCKYQFNGKEFDTGPNRNWKVSSDGLDRAAKADRLRIYGKSLSQVRFLRDFNVTPLVNIWNDTVWPSFGEPKDYIVQTLSTVVKRCLLMATDPGDLVLDPTCGSGTTATVAEQWGRRWVTIDTSRVALALARQRLMSARYPSYLLADSAEGRAKEAALTKRAPLQTPTHGDLRQGFVYERAPHVTLKSIANNAEIDVIWEEAEAALTPLLAELNAALGTDWREWEVPRELDDARRAVPPGPPTSGADTDGGPGGTALPITPEAERMHAAWWERRTRRQADIDASIARVADVEMLYDRPYEDKSKVRVAGPFTVESLSPHRVVPMDDEGIFDDEQAGGMPGSPQHRKRAKRISNEAEFANAVLENLKASGVQTGDRRGRIEFDSLTPFAGDGMIHAQGVFTEDGERRTAAICIGPEYGTLHRTDLTAAAREAAELRMDALVACAFAYDAHATELKKLGPLPIIKAKMNPDLHMAEALRTDKNANLFMVIGEPDVELIEDGESLRVKVLGLDLVKPQEGGKPLARGTDEIAAWFVDTDYDEETFFVRQAYFLGAGDPYKSLKTALKAEVDKEAWETLYSDTSRPFPRPEGGRIAVKVIDHYGDEVMRVMGV